MKCLIFGINRKDIDCYCIGNKNCTEKKCPKKKKK